MEIILDDNNVRKLSPPERFEFLKDILKNSKDESARVDAVWLASEMAEIMNAKDPLFDEISELLVWVLKNDDNGVVKHEAAFEIGAKNMRKKIPELMNAALHDQNILTRHESLEALGIIRAHECKEMLKKALEDPVFEVRETALFVLKRLERIEKIEKNS
jgi:HEAT repeat protein